MNSITLTGRLTTDPSRRSVTCAEGPRTVATLPLAVEGGGRDEVCFVDVEVWGSLAEACATYLAKGRRVAVAGRLRLDRWSAEDGTPRRAHRVVAAAVEFLDRTAAEPAA